MGGTLHLVGTPIGNLDDLTDRARRTLAGSDLVAAEDTRRTGRLLAAIGAKRPLLSFYEGNETARVPEIIGALEAGKDVAVVTDAGMPGISDPGYRLVAACVEKGIPVEVVPGPSAAVAALVVSGLPSDRFVFEGFLPRRGRARGERLSALVGEPRTVVLFESPRRLVATLRDLLESCGDRRVAVARELTKLHEEVIRGSMSEVVAGLSDREVKGEVVVVMEGSVRGGRTEDAAGDLAAATAVAAGLVADGLRKREAARRASASTGIPSAVIYRELVHPEG